MRVCSRRCGWSRCRNDHEVRTVKLNLIAGLEPGNFPIAREVKTSAAPKGRDPFEALLHRVLVASFAL